MIKKIYCQKNGKEKFATRADAQRALNHMTRKSNKPSGAVYWCEECQGYHVTHYGYRYCKDLKTKPTKKIPGQWDNRRDNPGQ